METTSAHPEALYKIMIVEDSRELLHVWRILFRTSTHFLLRCHSTGTAAVESVKDGFIPDLLITDYHLGDMKGLQVMDEIKKFAPKLETILVTGNTEDEALIKLASEGKIELFFKPVRFSDLVLKVRNILTLDIVAIQDEAESRAKSSIPIAVPFERFNFRS
jgi:DNA-binding NtrC family response regulator